MESKSGAQPPVTPRVLTTEEAAVYVGLAPKTLAMMRWRGEGPVHVKLCKKCAYLIADLDAWLLSRRRTSTSASVPPAVAA